jgi:death-on-curing protein
MDEVTWLREDVVRAIHRRQLAEHGGREGVRDPGLLTSALARPRQILAYSEPPPDLAALAAAYAFGILRNHSFVDGNKRVALVALRTFLKVNGHDLVATQEEKYQRVLHLADRQLSEAEFAGWVRDHPSPELPAAMEPP